MTDRRRGMQTLLGGLLALGLTRGAFAEAPRHVWVELPECSQPPYDAQQLSSSLQLELSPYGMQASRQTRGAPGGVHIRVLLPSCTANADSLLLSWEAPGTPPRRRELSLRDVPWSARARTLALWISDTLRPPRWQAEESAEAAPSGSSSEPSGLAPLPGDPLYDAELPHRSDPYPQRYPVYWSSAVRANWIPRVNVLLYGVSMGVAAKLLGPSEWAVDVSYAGGRSKVLQDMYGLDWVNAAVGIDVNLAPPRQVQIGPRLSVAHVVGYDKVNAHNLGESLAMIGGRVRISPRLPSERVSLDLTLDAGYPLTSLHENADADPLPWTAWTFALGTGLSVEL